METGSRIPLEWVRLIDFSTGAALGPVTCITETLFLRSILVRDPVNVTAGDEGVVGAVVCLRGDAWAPGTRARGTRGRSAPGFIGLNQDQQLGKHKTHQQYLNAAPATTTFEVHLPGPAAAASQPRATTRSPPLPPSAKVELGASAPCAEGCSNGSLPGPIDLKTGHHGRGTFPQSPHLQAHAFDDAAPSIGPRLQARRWGASWQPLTPRLPPHARSLPASTSRRFVPSPPPRSEEPSGSYLCDLPTNKRQRG